MLPERKQKWNLIEVLVFQLPRLVFASVAFTRTLHSNSEIHAVRPMPCCSIKPWLGSREFSCDPFLWERKGTLFVYRCSTRAISPKPKETKHRLEEVLEAFATNQVQVVCFNIRCVSKNTQVATAKMQDFIFRENPTFLQILLFAERPLGCCRLNPPKMVCQLSKQIAYCRNEPVVACKQNAPWVMYLVSTRIFHRSSTAGDSDVDR